MRNKLQTFTDFADALLPHETEYLLSNQQFEDKVKLRILERVHENSQRTGEKLPYDVSIDKRKYSHLKNWINDRLKAIDVDARFEWMIQTEQQIMTDSIEPAAEKRLLKSISRYKRPCFFFTKYYELAENYRHFLLIRMRYEDHKIVDAFLRKFRESYLRSKDVNDKIHTATADIVEHYSGNQKESLQWEEWLSDVFYDESLDGLNRYYALVRLTFLFLNYRRYDNLLDKFDYLDTRFKEGKYYSKRILLNYYHNRMLVHTKFKEYDKATHFGYLSIRTRVKDALLYVNNLSAILLRQNRPAEALEVLKSASQDMKETKNFHNKIGYVAFYVKCLNQLKKYKNAENYSDVFLRAYRNEIFAYRWHLFFSSYLESVLLQEKYARLCKVARKYKLLERDSKYRDKAVYLPVIPWYIQVARYKLEQINTQELSHFMQESLREIEKDTDKLSLIQNMVNLVKPLAPNVFRKLEIDHLFFGTTSRQEKEIKRIEEHAPQS